MKKITAEVLDRTDLTNEEKAELINWSLAHKEKTRFDPEVLFFPRTVITRAKTEDENLVYLPLHPVLMFECLAPKPKLSAGETAMSMFQIGEVTEKVAAETGYGEMFFVTNDEPQVRATQKRGWVIWLHDPVRHLWMMKKRVSLPKNTATASLDRE